MKLKLLKTFLLIVFSGFITATITIDGVLDEPAWENAQTLSDFVTVYPNDKSKPKYKTEVKIFSDDKGIYFGFVNEQLFINKTKIYAFVVRKNFNLGFVFWF